MKKMANIKDSIMMPPPKARPKSRSDTSEELRKNLIETITNTNENSALQEEFHKFLKEMEEIETFKRNDDELSISKSTSSINFDKFQPLCGGNTNCQNNLTPPINTQTISISKNDSLPGAFHFNLVHDTYISASDEEENLESQSSMEKLRKNLTQGGGFSYKKFSKLQTPKDKKEMKIFVENLLAYINEHEFDSTFSLLKIKIQTRYNDYKNKGLKCEYFKDCLVKMQSELISRICMINEGEKKIESESFEMLNRKHRRSSNEALEIKSLTSSSSSSSSSSSRSSPSKNTQISANSVKSNKKLKISKIKK